MTDFRSKAGKTLFLAFAALSLAACGGGDSRPNTGTLKLGITDAPVDEASEVVVQFSGVELKPQGGQAFSIDFIDPVSKAPTTKTLDLLGLQGTERAMLLDGEQIPAGDYEWIRLKVNADPNVAGDSYIKLTTDGAQCELRIPSGAETGLKLIRGFTIAVGTITDFTVDFDLRKSVVEPPGQQTTVQTCGNQAYLLKPVLRIVDNLQVGAISGVVDSNLILSACDASLSKAGKVYVFGPYAESDPVPAGVPDDVDGDPTDPIPEDPADGPDPLDSAIVSPDTHGYTIGFVPAGRKYVLAYTCDEDASDIDADALASPTPEADEVVTFTVAATNPVTVTANQTSMVDFP